MNPTTLRQVNLWTEAAEDAASKAYFAEHHGDLTAAEHFRNIEEKAYQIAGLFLAEGLEQG